MGYYNTYYSDFAKKPSAVYRLYDENDRLLYVGISTNPGTRTYAHYRKDWGHEIAYEDEEWFENREAAKAAERWAIHHENPVYNIIRPSMECC